MIERQRKLLDVQRKKQDTADRYLHRLEFLRQKLRAAEIKEEAMRWCLAMGSLRFNTIPFLFQLRLYLLVPPLLSFAFDHDPST
jgi:hypothetical protein